MVTKAKISFIKSLSDKKERSAAGLFAAEGVKLVTTLLEAGFGVEEVYALAEACDSLPFFNNITVVSPKEMERISHLKTPSNALALVRIPRHELDPGSLSGRLSLALDGVQDPGNLGTIIRIADWFGIADIVCSPDSADCYNPKTVQATMGAIANVRVHYAGLSGVLEQLQPVYGTFMEGENIYGATLTGNGIIVMGSEGRGISAGVEKHITHRLSIPSFSAHASESLNVASAAAVVCSEFRRR